MWLFLATVWAADPELDPEPEFDADAERSWILKSAPRLAKILCDGAPDERERGRAPEPAPMAPRTYIGCRPRTAAMLVDYVSSGSHDMLYNELDAIREFAPSTARKPARVEATVARLMHYLDNSWGPG